jgi:GMP synthase-like glutamine amidotransferase
MSHGEKASYTRFFENSVSPDPKELDLIIAMGGPMSVNDESTLPWLRTEKQFIHTAIKHGVSVLGICLGAQLVASALGCRVYRNPVKEIGWFPIEAISNTGTTFQFPPNCNVFHWHGETFDLPNGAIRLARSVVCENQAFQLNKNVIGMQFHLETTPQSAQALIENCSDELVAGKYIQSKSQLCSVPNEAFKEINDLMGRVMDYVTRGLTTGRS